VFAYRKITQTEWNKFYERYIELDLMSDSVGQLKEHISTFESALELMGCTANEDKLQDEVADVLAQFKSTGIKFSMITGDKTETAINIAKSCALVNNDSIKLYLIETSDLANLRDYKESIDALGKNSVFCITGDRFKDVLMKGGEVEEWFS